MAPGAQSGEKPPPKKGLRIPSQETLGQSALSPPAAQELAQRQAAAPAAPGQDCLSTSDTSRPPIAASQESSSREPVRAAAEVPPLEATQRNQPGQRLAWAKFARRLIIMASAVVLALLLAVSILFKTEAPPATSPAPKISAVAALGKADDAYHRTDYAEAIRWYRRAADQGNPHAQNNMGWLYEYGRGVAQDYGEAMRWFRLAAEQGNDSAQSNIGRLYENGWGVAQDYGEAMRWYRKAAEGGAGGQINVGRL
jgi:tetratricopeptide (TPR) repeat protein